MVFDYLLLTILLYHAFFLLDLHLIHPITELAMSIGIQTEDAKAKIKHTQWY